uniref:Glycosyltransferase n=1 Tax=Araucaria cunninghamii TaxID=56994 RepID=A0A0D6QTL2_ARACU
MENENGNASASFPHAVCVPFPWQSHVKALMNLAELLFDRGFFITFLNTEWIDERLWRPSQDVRRHKFRFLSFPDGLPPEHGRCSQLGELVVALQKSGPALERALRTAGGNGTSIVDVPPVTCIVTDSFMSCTHTVAKKLGVPRVLFWPFCAASSVAFKYSCHLQSQGHIPVKAQSRGNLITDLPGNIPPLRPTDLLRTFREQNKFDLLFSAMLYECQVQNKDTDYVLVNTFEELEGKDAAAGLSVNGCPALSIGPVFLQNFLQGKDSNSGTNMCEEDETCLQWLDAQKHCSLLYVSFGSSSVKSQEQLEELAVGLENSGQPFLWVLRPCLLGGGPAILPEGFKERTGDRGFLVNWTPQMKVLNHVSVGGFLTHCGWNSTLESISMGVPIIGWPFIGDQFLDCRFAKEVWKIGIDFEDVDLNDTRLVRRDEVENAVRRLMQTCEGEELRKRARDLKQAATKSVMRGGSSFRNMNTFVEDMENIVKSGGLYLE